MTISSECEQIDGCTMCSDSLECEHDCHKIKVGENAYHVCNNPDCHEQDRDEPSCVYQPRCMYENVTCSVCGVGKIRHSKN